MNRPPRRCNSRFASFLVACTAAVLLHGTLGKTGGALVLKGNDNGPPLFQMASTRKRGSAVGTYYDLKLCVKDTPETWAVVIDDNNATRRAKIANRTRVMVPERYIRRSDSEVARRILPSPYEVEVTTYAGVGVAGFQDGPRSSALFGDIIGICTGGKGDVYVAECKDNRIRRISPSGEVTTIVGSREKEIESQTRESTIRELIGADEICEGAADDVDVLLPHGMCCRKNGNLEDEIFIADSRFGRIRRIRNTATGFEVDTLLGKHVDASIFEHDSGPGGEAGVNTDSGDLKRSSPLSYPMDVAASPDGSIYIATGLFRYKLRQIPRRRFDCCLPSPLSYPPPPPHSADSANMRVVKLPRIDTTDAGTYRISADNQGVEDAIVESPGKKYAELKDTEDPIVVAGGSEGMCRDGHGTNAVFAYPMSIAVDKQGNVWVSDCESVNPMTVMKHGKGPSGEDPVSGLFFPERAFRNAPNQRIRLIVPSGEVTTVAGGAIGGHRDGFLPASRVCMVSSMCTWNAPSSKRPWWIEARNRSINIGGLEATARGEPIFFADTINQCIRRISNNEMSIVAGTFKGVGRLDGLGHVARFMMPAAIAAGPDGCLYVADNGNAVIRKIRVLSEKEIRKDRGDAGVPHPHPLSSAEELLERIRLDPFGALERTTAEMKNGSVPMTHIDIDKKSIVEN